MKKISVVIAQRHATSITLEPPFYEQLKKIAAEKKLSINAIITQIDNERGEQCNLSSAIRIYILRYLQGNT